MAAAVAAPRQLVEGKNGLMKYVLRNGNSSLEVYRQGATITSWMVGGEELVFLSERALFRTGSPIRGGIHLNFPKFNGLAYDKNSKSEKLEWMEKDGRGFGPVEYDSYVDLVLSHKAERVRWEISLRISLDPLGAVDLRYSVTNTSRLNKPFWFGFGILSHLRVPNLSDVVFDGLGVPFENMISKENSIPPVFTASGIQRIYHDPAEEVTVRGTVRPVRLTHEGTAEYLLWNPGNVSRDLPDMVNREYKSFICLGPAYATNTERRRLEPKGLWEGRLVLKVVLD